MKLTTAQITGFLNKPDVAARVILIYGPDAGLVHERAEALAKKLVPDVNDPFSVASLAPNTVTDDPARLADEMAAQSLMGGRRLVRIQHATEGIGAALNSLLKDMPNTDSMLLVEAGELEKKSKIRAACEQSEHAVAIPCYVEDGAARQRTITEILSTEGLKISSEIAAYLANILPPDRLAMRSELEKLALYARNQGAITMDDVKAVIEDAGAAELDDLAYAIGAGEAKQAARLIDRLYAEQTSPVAILRTAQRHFLRLQWARHQMERGQNAAEAVKRLQPPVFWKHEASMTKQLARWPSVKIEKALATLFDAEAAVKRTGTPDTALCAQTLLGLAR